MKLSRPRRGPGGWRPCPWPPKASPCGRTARWCQPADSAERLRHRGGEGQVILAAARIGQGRPGLQSRPAGAGRAGRGCAGCRRGGRTLRRRSVRSAAAFFRSSIPSEPGPPGMPSTPPIRRAGSVAGNRARSSVTFRPSGSAQFTGTSIEAHRIPSGPAQSVQVRLRVLGGEGGRGRRGQGGQDGQGGAEGRRPLRDRRHAFHWGDAVRPATTRTSPTGCPGGHRVRVRHAGWRAVVA